MMRTLMLFVSCIFMLFGKPDYAFWFLLYAVCFTPDKADVLAIVKKRIKKHVRGEEAEVEALLQSQRLQDRSQPEVCDDVSVPLPVSSDGDQVKGDNGQS